MKKVPAFSIEEQEQLEHYIHTNNFANLLLLLGRHIQEDPSPQLLARAVEKYWPHLSLHLDDNTPLLNIIGTAHLAMLELEDALAYFKQTQHATRLQQTLTLAKLHGNGKVVDEINNIGTAQGKPELTLSPAARQAFYELVVLPRVPMHHNQQGYYIEEHDLEHILAIIAPADERALFTSVLERLTREGNHNHPKQAIFAQLTQNPDLIRKYQEQQAHTGETRRSTCGETLAARLAQTGGRIIRVLQHGDTSPYFPLSSNIFLVENDGAIAVMKENIRQYIDFSRLNGYSKEKEILELGLRHPNIVSYQESIRAGPFEFLAMDFIPGEPLRRYTQQLLPKPEVLGILTQIASALHYVQQRGIIYGDVKDKNFMYDGTTATLFDFGNCAHVGTLTPETFIHATPSTPRYLTPENLLEHRKYPASDVFQLGILAYQLLTGQHPFAEIDIKEGKHHWNSAILKYGIPNVYNAVRDHPVLQEDSELNDLLTHMLEKNHARRPTIQEAHARFSALHERCAVHA